MKSTTDNKSHVRQKKKIIYNKEKRREERRKKKWNGISTVCSSKHTCNPMITNTARCAKYVWTECIRIVSGAIKWMLI